MQLHEPSADYIVLYRSKSRQHEQEAAPYRDSIAGLWRQSGSRGGIRLALPPSVVPLTYRLVSHPLRWRMERLTRACGSPLVEDLQYRHMARPPRT